MLAIKRNKKNSVTYCIFVESFSRLFLPHSRATVKAIRDYNKDIIIGVDNTFITPYFFVSPERS